ncbi:hypothetical protein OBV_10570 [Oscillibacter valericigenes Sjm18-20]|nr:hypothetical protein OBV_10570 [Oscillibacter valericigenes Sjm18-20]
MNLAPLSERSNFFVSYHDEGVLSTVYLDFCVKLYYLRNRSGRCWDICFLQSYF